MQIFVSRNERIEQVTYGRHHTSPCGKDGMYEPCLFRQVRQQALQPTSL